MHLNRNNKSDFLLVTLQYYGTVRVLTTQSEQPKAPFVVLGFDNLVSRASGGGGNGCR